MLEKTLEELSRVGLDGLSLDRIAEGAEVNKTSIYRRWPTREALVAAALNRILVDRSIVTPDTGSLHGDLVAMLDPVCQLLDSALGKAGLRLALSDSASLVTADLTMLEVDQTAAPMVEVIARAQARHEWRRGVDPRMLTFMIVGAIMHRVILEGRSADPSWLDAVVSLALDGVRPREL